MERDSYWPGFYDFVAGETYAGGPSPNLKLVGKLPIPIGPMRIIEFDWLACCYAAIYNTSGTAALFNWWCDPEVVAAENNLQDWIEENKPGIPVHSNRRRTHGSPRKMVEGMRSLAEFTLEDAFERGPDYERLWAQIGEIKLIGRYFGIKLAGALKQLGMTEAAQPDIRANGAKNGRRTLALLYPHEAQILDMKTGGNSRLAVSTAERRAADVKLALAEQGLDVDWFQLEALLCEFNQMVKGSRYPGKTSDADLDVLVKCEEHFGSDSPVVEQVWYAREEVLPEPLVEAKKREDLLATYRDHGYVWSDGIYDRRLTEDPARPAVRSVPLTDWEPKTRPEGQK